MRGLWLRLLRGRGTSGYLEVGLPLVAATVITFVLLLLLGLQQGLDHRASRTAWRTPEAASGQPTAIQSGFVDYIAEHQIVVIELAALTQEPPAVPGMGRFPQAGEVWASPALAELIANLPADQLADRFPGSVTAELADDLLESPNELVAIIGRAPTSPSMIEERPPHQWHTIASMSPMKIDKWSTKPDIYQTTYRDIALLVVVFTSLPLVGLGNLASRLMAGRRQRRIAILRLLGAGTSQVLRLTMSELVTFAGIGAVCGAAIHQALLPWISRVSIKGGEWFPRDVQPGVLSILVTMVAVVAVLTLGALTGLVPAVRDPLATYRRARGDAASLRLLSVLVIGAAVALFWIRSSNPFVTIAFTVVIVLGWGLVATGPWVIGGLGRLLAQRAQRPATFLAGQRLSDNPRSAWRTVGGMTLASFIAGYVAVSLPVGLGNVGDYNARADRLDIVVAADSHNTTVSEISAVLQVNNVQADVETAEAPSWLNQDEWSTLSVIPHDPDSDLDRARTALIKRELWGPELQRSDDLPMLWLLRDGVVMGFLVLPVAALVALTSMIIGTTARIFEERESLIALTLVGIQQSVLLAAQRREMFLPTIILGGVAAIAGLISGSTLGLSSPFNAYSIGIFASLFALWAFALLLADRATRPVLQRVSSDLSERE